LEKAPQVIAALDIGTSMMRLVVVRHDLLGPALLAAEETPRPPGVAAAQRALRALVRRVELRAGLPLREVTLGVRSSGLLPTRRLPPRARAQQTRAGRRWPERTSAPASRGTRRCRGRTRTPARRAC
jgi:hypothetical protein